MKQFSFLAVFLILCTLNTLAINYEVGPGKAYSSLLTVPTHTLKAGDTVKVFYRAQPYYEKILLSGVGTADKPIVLIGIPDANGNRPIIDGTNALSSTLYSTNNQNRQLIKVGQDSEAPSDHIIIDGFVFKNANNTNKYTGNNQSIQTSYLENACAVRPEKCSNITLRNSDIYNCGNGLMGGQGSPQVFLIEKCYIYNNGLSTNLTSGYEHNVYFNVGRGSRLIIQYCRFGTVQNSGHIIKSRAESNIIRYNWLEGGKNGQLDLVDDAGNAAANSYVYGNVFIKPTTTENGRMFMWGQDAGNNPVGILYFYNNTCINKRPSGRFFDLNTAGRTLVADNNIFYAGAGGYFGSLNSAYGGSQNFLSSNITGATGLTSSVTAAVPGFVNYSANDLRLQAGSPCIDVISNYNYPGGYILDKEYVPHLQFTSKKIYNNSLDIGAFEYQGALPVTFGSVAANIRDGHLYIKWHTENEKNNDYFLIGLSKDGRVFSIIDSVKTKAKGGLSSREIQYTYSKALNSGIGVLNLGTNQLAWVLIGILILMAVINGSGRRVSGQLNSLILVAGISSLGFLSACAKSENEVIAEKEPKIFVRITQVDTDGTSVSSKVIQAVRD